MEGVKEGEEEKKEEKRKEEREIMTESKDCLKANISKGVKESLNMRKMWMRFGVHGGFRRLLYILAAVVEQRAPKWYPLCSVTRGLVPSQRVPP